MAELREIYEGKGPVLCRAKKRLRSILKSVVARIEDKNLVRAEIHSLRIKDLSSLQRKAEKNKWDADQALSRCGDLIGGRVVCNNVEDVYRFSELLKEVLPTLWGDFDVQDFIKHPNKEGYRALHVNFGLCLGESPLLPDRVHCEVQIRSRLQHAWAGLSHGDIYKQPNLPEDLRARAKDLAEVLAAADRIASDIRSRVTRETASPAQQPDLGRVSEEGLAYSFRKVFGRSPADYVVRRALNFCDRLHIAKLEEFPKLLMRSGFRDRVEKVYRLIFGVNIRDNEDFFLAALYAAAEGEDKAIRWVRKEAQREWRELESLAMREALSSLPSTIEDLIEELEDPSGETDFEGWAQIFGATSDCAICSTTIIQPFSFAESAVQHYEVSEADADDAHERIETAIRSSELEIGGWGDGSLCAYHNDQAAKKD